MHQVEFRVQFAEYMRIKSNFSIVLLSIHIKCKFKGIRNSAIRNNPNIVSNIEAFTILLINIFIESKYGTYIRESKTYGLEIILHEGYCPINSRFSTQKNATNTPPTFPGSFSLYFNYLFRHQYQKSLNLFQSISVLCMELCNAWYPENWKKEAKFPID